MNLQTALETGWICGVETVGEAVDTAIRCLMIGSCSDEEYTKRALELAEEYDCSGVKDEQLIKDVLLSMFNINTDDIDKRVGEDLERLDNKLKGEM